MKNILNISLLFSLLLTLGGCQTAAEKRLDDNADKRAKLHYQLGLDALHKGLVPKAFEKLYLSDKIKPNQPDTLDAIAYAWRLRGNDKKAEEFYQKAIRHDAGSATRNNYGSLLVSLGRYNKAIENLNIALEDPRYRNQPLAFVNLGDAYVGLKSLEQAVAAYRNAKRLDPNWTYPQLKEAEAYLKFNRKIYAQALYETILRKDSANYDALAGLIPLQKSDDEKLLLRQYIQSFIDTNPDAMQKAWAKEQLNALDKRKQR